MIDLSERWPVRVGQHTLPSLESMNQWQAQAVAAMQQSLAKVAADNIRLIKLVSVAEAVKSLKFDHDLNDRLATFSEHRGRLGELNRAFHCHVDRHDHTSSELTAKDI